MNWEYFDRIFCINLPNRTDRRTLAQAEFDVMGVRPEWASAIQCDDGRLGLQHTLLGIFTRNRDARNILIFEDDVQFINDPIRTLQLVLEDLPKFDLLYFGGNVMGGRVQVTPNLNRITRTLAAHAICYNRSVFDRYIDHLDRIVTQDCISCHADISDVFLTTIQDDGHSFMVNPIIATQRPGYSDLENKYTDYSSELNPVCNQVTQIDQFASLVKQCVCREINIAPELIEVKHRGRERVLARCFLFGFLKLKFPGITLNRIAMTIGFKPDHATVMHSFKQLNNMLIDPCQREEAEMYSRLRHKLFGK